VITISEVINAVKDVICRVEFGVDLIAIGLLVMMGYFSSCLYERLHCLWSLTKESKGQERLE
jgi:hypothetical protein